jgi:hypothetical protein
MAPGRWPSRPGCASDVAGATAAEVTPGSWPGDSHAVTAPRSDGPGMDPARPPGPRPGLARPRWSESLRLRPGGAWPGHAGAASIWPLGELAESDLLTEWQASESRLLGG